MSNGDAHVRPGEVISSDLINQILDRLAALEEGGSGSETGPIRMDGFEPPEEQEVGRVLAILGQNLPFPAVADSVTIGGVPVPEENMRIASSNRERLEFIIPELAGLPADRFVRVSDGTSSAQLLYRFLPSSGGPPTPIIDRIEGATGNPNAPIAMGAVAVIIGENFSPDAADNTITMRPLGQSPEAEPYPRPGGPGLDVQSTTAERIEVVVPDMEEIETTDGAVRVRVEILVNGAPDPATGEFFAFRL